MVEGMNIKDLTFQRLDESDKYKRVLASVEDEETRKKIDSIVRGFISQLSEGLAKLDEPEVKKKLAELMKNG